MKYSELISISKQFKSSVNIEYDLSNFSKLAEYIPTEDACEILGHYFNSFKKSEGNNRSTILEGPYGKGKSYLLLTLLHLISFSNDDEEYVKEFLCRLKSVDEKLYEMIEEFNKAHFKLLPVIINSNYSHLSQSLNIALKEALNRIGMDELFPDTAYSVCLDIIKKWKNDEESSKNILDACIKTTGTNLDGLEKGLKKYSPKSYEKFVRLYNCVVNGLEFNPFTNDDVVKNYSDISNKLNSFGYDGLFIVFDEFSKFIEADNDGLTNDLKILQDLAEMASRSGVKGQIHLCCITHKSLSSYYRNKNEITANAFKTVEGRFKEYRFNRSLNQNYRIISMTLKKAKEFNDFFSKKKLDNLDLYKFVAETDLFAEIDNNLLCRDCFPLNPFTTYAVIQVSELIAQNERTLFTFISDNDINSLNTFIKNNNSGLFNVDRIYDYFEEMIEKSDDGDLRKIAYQAKVCLQNVENDLQQRIIKVLSIINIIGNFDRLAPKDIVIANCLNEDSQKVTAELVSLTNLNILKKSFATDNYDFAQTGSRFIEEKIEKYQALKGKNESVSSILNQIYDSRFVLPHKYNENNKMIRFYKELFITDCELLRIDSFKPFYSKYFCDGLIFDIIQTDSSIDVKKTFDNISDNQRVICKLTGRTLNESVNKEIYRLNSLKALLADKNLDDLLKVEIRLMIEDESEELITLLEEYFEENNVSLISNSNLENLRKITSQLFENVFNKSPIINNEMINKESNVSQQYSKPRNAVVNMYVNKNLSLIDEYSVTSPERTVFNSFDPSEENTRAIINQVKDFINGSEKEKISFESLIQQLKNPPYGVRGGVIPLFIGYAIYELSGEVLLYFENKEIDVKAENINKIEQNPDKYYVEVEIGTSEKKKYLADMMTLFGVQKTASYRDNVKLTVTSMKKWLMSLPKVIRNSSKKNNILSLDKEFIEFKSIMASFNLNNHNVLLKEIPKIFGDYKKTIRSLRAYKENIYIKLNEYNINLANRIKVLFNDNEECSLANVLKEWSERNDAEQRILENDEKSIITLINTMNYDDVSLVDDIAKIITGLKITDWSLDNSENIITYFANFDENIQFRKMLNEDDTIIVDDEKEIELSPFGSIVKNNIEEVFEEFADSISNEEKLQILKKLIKDLM